VYEKKIHADVMVFACKARIFHYHLGMAVEATNFVLDAMEIIWLCIVFGYICCMNRKVQIEMFHQIFCLCNKDLCMITCFVRIII